MGGSLHITRSATSSNYTRGTATITSLSGLSYGTNVASVGGYYAGSIQWPNGNIYDLIIPPAGTWPSNYAGFTDGATPWSNTSVSLTVSDAEAIQYSYDGKAATDAWYSQGFIGANLKNKNIGGFTDWYVPSIYELYEIYRNFKPVTTNNITANLQGTYPTDSIGMSAHQVNPYAVGGRFEGTAINPPRTSVSEFIKPTGSQYIGRAYYFSSTPTKYSSGSLDNPDYIHGLVFDWLGAGGGGTTTGQYSISTSKTNGYYRIPVRRILRT